MLPTDAKSRKDIPIYSGFIKYFPKAIAAVAELSRKGNDQHNPGKPLHWDRSKSGDELDALMRHTVDRAMGSAFDTDGVRHATKRAWRAMADLEKELEDAEAQPVLAKDEGNPWREWQGGDYPPCAGDKLVEFKMRGWPDETYKALAVDLRWEHIDRLSDIVAWRFA